jgi:uncharacterized protein
MTTPGMTTEVIDCELHVTIPGLRDLTPYVDSSWTPRLTTSEFRLPPAAGPHPGVRLEARELRREASDPVVVSRSLSDECGGALLVPSQALVTSGWLNHAMAAAFVSAVNDYVVGTWLDADPRFHFAIVVPSHDGVLAAAEIRRLGQHPRAAAVCLSPVAVNLGQPHYYPIYEAAQELGLPVVLHPSGFEGSTVGPAMLGGVGPRTPEETFSLIPQIGAVNLMSLVFDGVFMRYPGLRVVLAGVGFDWAVSALWRADAEWRGLRVEVPWLTRPPSQVVAEHVRFVVDGSTHVVGPDLWALAGMLPPGCLVWGSDAPFSARSAADTLVGAPAALRAAVASENAVATFSRLRQPTPI